MKLFSLLAIFILSVLPATVIAQVNQLENRNSLEIYSSEPCPAGSNSYQFLTPQEVESIRQQLCAAAGQPATVNICYLVQFDFEECMFQSIEIQNNGCVGSYNDNYYCNTNNNRLLEGVVHIFEPLISRKGKK